MTPENERSVKQIAALWAFDKSGRYPPQFVGAVSDGLWDAWPEEAERIREEAVSWFLDFGDDEVDRWEFETVFQSLPERSHEALTDAR